MDKEALMAFFKRLDRSQFLDNDCRSNAACDIPLPIGRGQTISQPSLVVHMTLLLDPKPGNRVLEIGTGSGYQTAFLAEFSKEVYTLELFESFTRKAGERLKALGYRNVFYRTGDGSEGWPEQAPFDRIMVTAAAAKIPGTLAAQLAARGRMLVPVGNPGFQVLKLVCKDENGTLSIRGDALVRFVEMKGRYGWR